jgi:hypothetical protein
MVQLLSAWRYERNSQLRVVKPPRLLLAGSLLSSVNLQFRGRCQCVQMFDSTHARRDVFNVATRARN